MTAVDDLAAWLGKIWDEDKAREYEAIEARLTDELGGDLDGDPDEVQEMLAADLARSVVLARIAADRQILAEYVARDRDVDLMLGPPIQRQREWIGLRLAVRILASAYADRPGYQEAWRPA